MSDGIAPAVDKVGAPEPTAPEAQAGAPTMDTTTAPVTDNEKQPEAPKIPEGAGPAVGAPKPVEVMSVPETPINDRTPAGGTPRPELRIDEDPKEPPKEEEPVVITGVEDPAPTSTASIPGKPDEGINGAAKSVDASMTGAIQSEPVEELDASVPTGEKRKADEPAVTETTTINGNDNSIADVAATAVSEKSASDEPAEKKAKVDDSVEDESQQSNGKSKAKKEKKTAPAVGKTARKTRSQGPVETA